MSGRQLETGRPEPRPVAELQPHPQAAEVSPLSEGDYRALREDIDSRGVLVPIEVTGGGVVPACHRCGKSNQAIAEVRRTRRGHVSKDRLGCARRQREALAWTGRGAA